MLLSLDPLAALAGRDEEVHTELAKLTPSDERALHELWQVAEARARSGAPTENPPLREQYMVLIECTDERMQVALLEPVSGGGVGVVGR